MSGGPQLALLARLGEAVRWDDLVRRHESDPWAYLRRKLRETAGPLKDFKQDLYAQAKARLLEDLARPLMPPGSLEAHRETFDQLLTAGDFADLAFHLDPRADRATRLESAKAVLAHAKILTLFDHEAAPPDKRSPLWQKRVADMSERLNLPGLTRIAGRGELTPARRARLARRLRRELGEYLSVTHAGTGVREEVTPFMLGRIETSVAAALRFLDAHR